MHLEQLLDHLWDKAAGEPELVSPELYAYERAFRIHQAPAVRAHQAWTDIVVKSRVPDHVQYPKKFGAGDPVHATPLNLKLRPWGQ